MKFKLQCERIEDSGSILTYEFNAVTLPELLKEIKNFLMGVGYTEKCVDSRVIDA